MDPTAAELLKYLQGTNYDEDVALCALMLSLNTVLPPIPASPRYKPTIIVAQEDTILFVDSVERAGTNVQQLYADYAVRGLPIVPKIVVIGKGLGHSFEGIFVFYDDFYYKVQSIGRAIDVLIKLTAVYGLPYSKVSKLVWHFISGVVYGVPQRETYVSISRLQAFLTAASNQAS